MEAIDRLRRALAEFVVKGIKTSIPFHQKVVRHPVFIAGRYDTSFIEAHMQGGKGGGSDEGEEAAEARRVAQMLAAIAAYRREKELASRAAAASSGKAAEDPWKQAGRRAQMRGGLR
jgi:acetyl-CoA carboxylase biotin carboxylase subunit